MRKTFYSLITLTFLTHFYAPQTIAKEGMRQPAKLKEQSDNLRSEGLIISTEKIYNNEGTGLNNAVVLFGRGCTGEVVSSKGLLFTNHHCGYGTVQALSSIHNNYLTEGFWAKSTQEEIPCSGLTATIVRKTENVTESILAGITDDMPENEREKQIEERISNLEKAYKNITGYEAQIKPFYNGNEYWVSLMEVFRDIRLVGFPPNGIGKFGADTDNWMWPRMTGDFAVFRIDADKNNKPAEFNVNNKPYQTKNYFKINTSGYKEGDFTMVYGFPYTTQQYISSYQLSSVQHIVDPIRIESRRRKLSVWDSFMRQDGEIFLKYASKQSSVSNGYKKWQGEIMGLEKNNVIRRKQAYEEKFQATATASHRQPEDKMLLSQIQVAVNAHNNALTAEEYLNENVFGIEIIRQAAVLDKILQLYRSNIAQSELISELNKIKINLTFFYKDYLYYVDKRVFEVLMEHYMRQDKLVVAPELKKLYYNAGNNMHSWAGSVFGQSLLAHSSRIYELLDQASKADSTIIKNDPAYQIYYAANTWRNEKVEPSKTRYSQAIKPVSRKYMKRQMEYNIHRKSFYPDANQTLRLSYGQVRSIALEDSDIFQTTIDDLVSRHNSEVDEFNIPARLRGLYLTKDFGRWGQNGTVPVNFIASNHTSGGNSGSPVLNAKGELIGINFDRIWQGTMSDIYFDENLCRNISVDIRFVLFIIEKYGDASWLFKEMDLVN